MSKWQNVDDKVNQTLFLPSLGEDCWVVGKVLIVKNAFSEHGSPSRFFPVALACMRSSVCERIMWLQSYFEGREMLIEFHWIPAKCWYSPYIQGVKRTSRTSRYLSDSCTEIGPEYFIIYLYSFYLFFKMCQETFHCFSLIL